uniref:G-protein coupled receptors family 1 profile domain-containing protein n=1 Tax=Romanomermis culicivorax TaxID=13658 RepID=A0A915IHX5_ROMCU
MSHSNTNLLQEQMITYQTIVGIIFLVVSFFASCTNMAACLAIISSKDLRGSFYIFSFNAIFGDLISLIGIGFFIGLTLVLDSTFGQAGQRIFGMLADLGWFCKDVFMILVCLTPTLVVVRRKLKKINLVSESSPPSNTAANADMRRREIKLFLQSFVSSAIHLTGAFVPLFVPDNTATRLFRYIWSLVNLCDYGAVLLIMNKDVRSKIILGVKTFKVK